MNSLTELNGFVTNFSLPFTDQRLPDVIFDRSTPVNQTQTVDRGFTINASIGIEIIEILNAPLSNPIYSIDLTALPAGTLSYASLPAGVTLTNVVSGIFVLTGFVDKTQWDLIKSPVIDFDDNFVGSFTYVSTINYVSHFTGQQARTHTTAVVVNNVIFWTTATQFIYALSAVTAIVGQPILGNLDALFPGVIFSVSITPSTTGSINTFTTTGTGGTFSVNGSTKVITIVGTRTQVNSRIQGLQIDANAQSIDLVLTYFASNNLNGVTDTRTQTLISQGLSVLGAVSQPTIVFLEDTSFVLTGAPPFTDSGFDGTGTYTYTITPSDVAAIANVTFGGQGGTVNFNSSTKVITVTGNRSQVNARLAFITIIPAVDYDLTFNLQYFGATPRADVANKIQVVSIGSNDTEITNMNFNRTYVANNGNDIFAANTPFISDFDTSNASYTVIFDCAIGQWTVPTTVNPYVESALANPISITGTRAEINSKFAQIRFYPTALIDANSTFTFTQIKNGVTQVTQSVALLGTPGSFANSRNVDFVNSVNYIPPQDDVLYGKIDKILLVGGGGAGAVGGIFSGQHFGAQGGGGGGVVFSSTDILFTNNTTYPIIIGAGGIAPSGSGTTTSAFGISIGGGAGGGAANGVSGPLSGNGASDHNGLAGGAQSSVNNSLGGRNAGGGGGHPSPINQFSGLGANGTSTSGGRGGAGADEAGGPNTFWAGGGGGGGNPTRGSAGASSTFGQGANSTNAATPGAANRGAGGGGGFGANAAGANGGSGFVRITVTQK